MKALIKSIKKILEDNKAERISIIDVTNKSSVTDTMFIVSGRSSRHVQAIADNLVDKLKEKKIKLEKQEAEKFYQVHQTKPFYNDLCSYLSSGPIIVMVLEKEDAVAENRKLMGATDPKKAENGTLRKKYGISIDKNSVHGSDSSENAKIEIDFFFKD